MSSPLVDIAYAQLVEIEKRGKGKFNESKYRRDKHGQFASKGSYEAKGEAAGRAIGGHIGGVVGGAAGGIAAASIPGGMSAAVGAGIGQDLGRKAGVKAGAVIGRYTGKGIDAAIPHIAKMVNASDRSVEAAIEKATSKLGLSVAAVNRLFDQVTEKHMKSAIQLMANHDRKGTLINEVTVGGKTYASPQSAVGKAEFSDDLIENFLRLVMTYAVVADAKDENE